MLFIALLILHSAISYISANNLEIPQDKSSYEVEFLPRVRAMRGIEEVLRKLDTNKLKFISDDEDIFDGSESGSGEGSGQESPKSNKEEDENKSSTTTPTTTSTTTDTTTYSEGSGNQPSKEDKAGNPSIDDSVTKGPVDYDEVTSVSDFDPKLGVDRSNSFSNLVGKYWIYILLVVAIAISVFLLYIIFLKRKRNRNYY